MKHFLDTEFIEGFCKPLFGKRRHFIDLISIGVVCEDGREFYAISNEYNYSDADEWVKKNVILPMYKQEVHGDGRNNLDVHNFHKYYGLSRSEIVSGLLDFFGCWRDQHFWRAPENIEMYGYYADYDWVLFCSLFGRMIDLPKQFPMHCRDLKQELDGRATKQYNLLPMNQKIELIKGQRGYPKQVNEHNALADAKWNQQLYNFIQVL